MAQFVYVGSTGFGQATVQDSPAFGKITVGEARKGVSVFQVGQGGSLTPTSFFELGVHAGWLAQHPSNGHIYAVGGGKLHALRLGPSGTLIPVNSADTLGNGVYLDISQDGRWALVANYSAGTLAVLPILESGEVGEATDSKLHGMQVKPELADRQECCHPHQVRLDPKTNRWALACDLGADRVYVYAFNAEQGALVGAANSRRHLQLPDGAGPRHLDFHPNGSWVYILCELDGHIAVCDWDDKAGALSIKQRAYVMPLGATCCRAHHSGMAHILVSADGKTVYASSRTDNQIVVFQVNTESGELTRAQSVPSGGVCPRNFHLDYSSAPPVMRITNQDSQNITIYSISTSGELTEPPVVLELDRVCPPVVLGPILL